MSAYKKSKKTVGHYFERISVVFFYAPEGTSVAY